MAEQPDISLKNIQNISIHHRQNDQLAGIVELKDNKLTFIAYDSDLKAYLQQNVPLWEMQTFTYPIGGMKEENNKKILWDGSRTTDISKPDFLNGLYSFLFKEVREKVFKMKYYFV